MNKLIIVGNGFDLHHGIPAGYEHFLIWYLSRLFKTAISEGQSENELFKLKCKNYIVDQNPIDVKDIDDLAFKYISENQSFNESYFRVNKKIYQFRMEVKSRLMNELLSHHYDLKWVDVEASYYHLLKRFLKQMLADESQREYVPLIQELNGDLKIIRAALRQYLGMVSRNRLPIDNFAYIAHDPIPSSLIIDKKARKLIEETSGDVLGTELKTEKVMFLNFNYTTICHRLESIGFGFNFIDIHGTLSQRDDQLIFGYGDEIDESYLEMEKTNFNDFLTHIKSFGYSQDSNYSELVGFINHMPFSVYIWGHSCGLSDRTLLNMIFEHENCAVIQPYYWKKSNGSDNYTEIVQNISRHFRDKQMMRNRVANKEFCQPL